ncbi:MAG: M23 family metallopeptidase [Actinomycetota bacterium]
MRSAGLASGFTRAILASALVIGLAAGPAGAITPVRHALQERHAAVARAQALRRLQTQLEIGLRYRIAAMEHLARTPVGHHGHANDRQFATLDATVHLLTLARSRLRSLGPWARGRLRTFQAHYARVQAWLDREGIFRVCPVPAYTTIYDNFGEMVRLPHVPVHRHQGDDIQAPSGVRIVAPFDGYASTSSSKLGGLEVRVLGAPGYVYNAHLSRPGQLGWVSAGTTVGYVGVTGDATGPHDHFEWHPGDGVAQDPNALLVAACVDG